MDFLKIVERGRMSPVDFIENFSKQFHQTYWCNFLFVRNRWFYFDQFWIHTPIILPTIEAELFSFCRFMAPQRKTKLFENIEEYARRTFSECFRKGMHLTIENVLRNFFKHDNLVFNLSPVITLNDGTFDLRINKMRRSSPWDFMDYKIDATYKEFIESKNLQQLLSDHSNT